jgi:hypothetical protein
MPRSWFLAAFAAAVVGGLAAVPARTPAQEAKRKVDVDAVVERGLEYLKKTQAADGHWDASGGNYPTTMTALAGMCFLMDGSTLREGKYSDQVTKAMGWFLAGGRQTERGCLGNLNNPTESQRYMYGHGFGLLFLACVYGEEEDNEQRKKLEAVLKKAVQFTAEAQTTKKHKKRNDKGEVVEVEIGGWGYVSAKDGSQFDEGSVTITQLQGLRAARNAGIPVPKETIEKAKEYLEACTTSKGGVIYSYAGSGGGAAVGQERAPITAAAVACGFAAGEYDSKLPKMWVKFCRDNIPIARGRVAHDEYQSYYLAQAIYVLGDDRYGKLFPNEPKDKWLTWSGYKDAMFPYLAESQDKGTGGWQSGYIGPVFSTSVNLTILQLEKGILPIYHR